MNQNSVLTENMERKSTNDNFERPAETSVTTSTKFVLHYWKFLDSLSI